MCWCREAVPKICTYPAGKLLYDRRSMSTLKAVVALLIAVLALSLVPLVIEKAGTKNTLGSTNSDSSTNTSDNGTSDTSDNGTSDNGTSDYNPFTFATIQTLAMIIVLVIYLRVTAPRKFGTTKLRNIIGSTKNLFASSYVHKKQSTSPIAYVYNQIAFWVHVPLLWAVIVGLEYSLFSWSARYIETAVTSIIYGIWPLVMIYALIYLSRSTEGAQQYHIFFQKKVLTALAAVGIVFVAYSQINTDKPLFDEVLLDIASMLIAFLAAVLNAMNPAMTIHFSDLLYQITPCRKSDDPKVIAQQKLWLSVCAVAAGRTLSLPLNLAIGFILFDGNLGITLRALLLAIGAGIVLLPAASILLRLANLSISDLSINALCYAEPIFSLIWFLIFTRVEVPRFDLFMVGAGIIVATNILMQIVPDINLGTRPSTGRKKHKQQLPRQAPETEQP